MKITSIFSDCFKMRNVTSSELGNFKDSWLSGTGNELPVVFDATHSGFVNHNLKLYIPALMKKGTDTFYNRKKPAKILKHHDRSSDPVGIIKYGEYVDTTPEHLKTNPDVSILNDENRTLEEYIGAAKRFINSGIPTSKDFPGLGYIKLYGVLKDEKAISQVEDGLFDAVSTSFSSPNYVFCSECQQNLIVDGMCEHSPGEIYEDDNGSKSLCVWIPGEHFYDECSLVVFDADPFTSIQIGTDTPKQYKYNISTKDLKADDADFSRCPYQFKDSEEGKMTRSVLSDNKQKVFEVIKKLHPDLEDSILLGYAGEIDSLKKEGFYPGQDDSNVDEDLAIKDALENLLKEKERVNADAIYSEMKKELPKESVLSSTKLKKLPSSAFCGPDRSFPVPDAEHLVAATSVLDNYTGARDKAKILASLQKKAKLFNVPKETLKDSKEDKEDNKEKFVLPKQDSLKDLTDKDASSLFAMIESELIQRDLKVQRDCSKCAESEDKAKQKEEEATDALKKAEDAEQTLKVVREEYRLSLRDYLDQVDSFISLETKFEESEKEHYALLSVLKGTHKDTKEALLSFQDKEVSSIKVMFEDFDISALQEKLNNGMSNVPTGTVVNPGFEDSKEGEIDLSEMGEIATKTLKNIKEFLKNEDEVSATILFAKAIKIGIFPDSINLEKIKAEVSA